MSHHDDHTDRSDRNHAHDHDEPEIVTPEPDEPDDHDPSRKLPRWIWYTIIGLGGSIALVLLVKMVTIARDPLPPTKEILAPLPREAFRARLMGSTMDEVVEMLGVPTHTTNERKPGSTWSYRDRAYDPTNGRTDSYQGVHFGLGTPPRVEAVSSN